MHYFQPQINIIYSVTGRDHKILWRRHEFAYFISYLFTFIYRPDQPDGRVARHCGLLQVSVYTKCIENMNMYHFEFSFGNSFSIIFSEFMKLIWKIMSDFSFQELGVGGGLLPWWNNIIFLEVYMEATFGDILSTGLLVSWHGYTVHKNLPQ